MTEPFNPISVERARSVARQVAINGWGIDEAVDLLLRACDDIERLTREKAAERGLREGAVIALEGERDACLQRLGDNDEEIRRLRARLTTIHAIAAKHSLTPMDHSNIEKHSRWGAWV